MHLGDVYYSGTEKEVDARFLKVWPTDAATLNRALNGNHEMYSGGFGYFKLILPAFKQESSYFALQNEHWLLVGLDTAYVDHDIDNQQVAWLNLILNQAGARKLVLFSHQQPFSRLDAQGPKLQKALKRLLDDRRITAWYWGHEHECVIYDPHPAWGLLGRCLGNGGIPSARKKDVRSAPADPAPGGRRLHLAAAHRHGRLSILHRPRRSQRGHGRRRGQEEVRAARLHDARDHRFQAGRARAAVERDGALFEHHRVISRVTSGDRSCGLFSSSMTPAIERSWRDA